MPPKARKKKAAPEIQEEKKAAPKEKKSEESFKIKTSDQLISEKSYAKRIFVKPENRITDNVIRKPELARLLGVRAELYSKNQIAFTNLTTQTTEEEVAKKELMDKKFPLYLLRIMTIDSEGNEIVELFDVNEMTIPNVEMLHISNL